MCLLYVSPSMRCENAMTVIARCNAIEQLYMMQENSRLICYSYKIPKNCHTLTITRRYVFQACFFLCIANGRIL